MTAKLSFYRFGFAEANQKAKKSDFRQAFFDGVELPDWFVYVLVNPVRAFSFRASNGVNSFPLLEGIFDFYFRVCLISLATLNIFGA